MPGYQYTCGKHTLIETHPIGTAPRAIDCLFCRTPMKLVIGAGVQVARSALENKGSQVRGQIEMERDLDRDRPAYKRMRDRGLQPDQVQGSAALEDKVDDQFDIKYRDVYPTIPKHELQEQMTAARLGIDL